MWTIDTSLVDLRLTAKFSKLHRQEYDSCFANLEKVLVMLRQGIAFTSLGAGFLHAEGYKLSAISQTPHKGRHETRLYFTVVEDTQTIFVLGIGSKAEQRKDLRKYSDMIAYLHPSQD